MAIISLLLRFLFGGVSHRRVIASREALRRLGLGDAGAATLCFFTSLLSSSSMIRLTNNPTERNEKKGKNSEKTQKKLRKNLEKTWKK